MLEKTRDTDESEGLNIAHHNNKMGQALSSLSSMFSSSTRPKASWPDLSLELQQFIIKNLLQYNDRPLRMGLCSSHSPTTSARLSAENNKRELRLQSSHNDYVFSAKLKCAELNAVAARKVLKRIEDQKVRVPIGPVSIQYSVWCRAQQKWYL